MSSRAYPKRYFATWKSLKWLWLNVNEFRELPEELFADLSALRVLLLHG